MNLGFSHRLFASFMVALKTSPIPLVMDVLGLVLFLNKKAKFFSNYRKIKEKSRESSAW
jgi:hypothetical protein